MSRNLFLTGLILITVSINTSFSQKIREIPKAVEKSFAEKYSGATNVKYTDQLLSVDVSFDLNGEKMLASYSNKGVWKGTTREWAFDKLPADVKDGFKKSRYADRTVDEARVLELPNDSTQYRILVRRSDIEKKYLYFNATGRLVRESLTL
jgi:hypothetical protein